MGFLVEISENLGKTNRFLTSLEEQIFISEDKCGVLEISNEVSKALFIIKHLGKSNFQVEPTTSKLTAATKQTCKHFGLVANEDYQLKIFYISRQSELAAKINSSSDLDKQARFRLSCASINLDIFLFEGANISLGSSEHDSIVLTLKGIKPRHLELKLGKELEQCEIIACVGQVDFLGISNSAKYFTVGGHSFVLNEVN